MKHPTEDHSLFGIDILDELVEEYLQLNGSSENIEESAENADESNCPGVTKPFHEGLAPITRDMEIISLMEPASPDDPASH
ncbi:hypothetical protein CR513_01402, partial [Mucuna pruriens]